MNVFLTGATGYIGGTVAARLLATGHRVTGLARDASRAALLSERGITPVIGSLDNLDLLAREAAAADAVINAANADHPFAARALIDALRGSGKRFIQTSGTTVIADIACGRAGGQIYAEDTPFTPLPEKAGRVATDRMVRDAANDGVHSVVICPALVYGQGAGVREHSAQIPTFIELAKSSGVPRHIGAGENIWSHVHVADCADVYLLALERAPAGAFYYVEAGESAMVDLNRAIGRLLGLGETTKSMPMADAVDAWGPAMAYAMGANVRVTSELARTTLGWTPRGAALSDDIESGSYRQYR